MYSDVDSYKASSGDSVWFCDLEISSNSSDPHEGISDTSSSSGSHESTSRFPSSVDDCLEGDKSEANDRKRSKRLRADVPEFVPRNLCSDASCLLRMPEEAAVEECPKGSPLVRKQLDKEVQMNCKLINVATQTQFIEEQKVYCNGEKQEPEAKPLHMEDKINFQKQLEVLFTDVKQKSSENSKLMLAEHAANVTNVKLESYKEYAQEKIENLQNKLAKQVEKNEQQSKTIQSMQFLVTTYAMQYINLQGYAIVEHLTKCHQMISDLTSALSCLTISSIPTVNECKKCIRQWEGELEKTQKCFISYKEHYDDVIKSIRNSDYTGIPIPPQIFMQLRVQKELLHESFVPAVSAFARENWNRICQQQHCSHWYNIPESTQHTQTSMVGLSLENYAQNCNNQPQMNDTVKGELDTKLHNNSLMQWGENSFKIVVDAVAKDLVKKTDDSIAVPSQLNHAEEATAPDAFLPYNYSMSYNMQNGMSTTTDNLSFWQTQQRYCDESSEGCVGLENDCKTKAKSKGSTSEKASDEALMSSTNSKQKANSTILCPKGHKDLSHFSKLGEKHSSSFFKLFMYVRSKIPDRSDMEIEAALKRIRYKKKGLSGISNEAIVEAVKEDLSQN